MKSQTERINRFKRAYPDQSNKMTDREIIQYLNFGKQLHKEINNKFQ